MYVLIGAAVGALLFSVGITLYYRWRRALSPEWLDILFWVIIGVGALVRWLQILQEAYL